jgi:hypothetical protein
VQSNTEALLASMIALEKQCVLHNLYMFVVLGIQHAMCLRHIAICGLSGSTILFFSHCLIKGTNVEKIIEHKACASIFSTLFV